jgi:hypothetical protein
MLSYQKTFAFGRWVGRSVGICDNFWLERAAPRYEDVLKWPVAWLSKTHQRRFWPLQVRRDDSLSLSLDRL